MSGRYIKPLCGVMVLLVLLALLSGCAKGGDGIENTQEPMKQKIVFFGDSITYMGDWESYFEGYDVTNLGVSGDKVQSLIDRIEDLYAEKPTKLFIMVGVNDILSGFDTKDVIADWRTLLELIEEHLPDCRVYVQSVLPVSRDYPNSSEIIRFNADLKALCDERGLDYIDLFPLYRDKSGYLMNGFTKDGLHLTPEAYGLWVEEIRKLVEE